MDYADEMQCGVSLDIVFLSIDRYSEDATYLFRLELNNCQFSFMRVKRSVFQSSVLSSALSRQNWLSKNRKQFYNMIVPKTKWLSG